DGLQNVGLHEPTLNFSGDDEVLERLGRPVGRGFEGRVCVAWPGFPPSPFPVYFIDVLSR
ncbi:MAG: hypothetical protein OEY99_08985, partial [Aigarchaeota archaeon]|nr:hypothetical protein [Aigarchaeota archaeon]